MFPRCINTGILGDPYTLTTPKRHEFRSLDNQCRLEFGIAQAPEIQCFLQADRKLHSSVEVTRETCGDACPVFQWISGAEQAFQYARHWSWHKSVNYETSAAVQEL